MVEPMRLRRIWRLMLRRCQNPAHKAFADYGGRGIVVCEAWSKSFDQFLADMGQPPTAKHTLERRDNNRGYEPSNCVWATRKEQQNNRRTNFRITLSGGETVTLTQLSERAGINVYTLRRRILSGLSPEEALSRPIRVSRPKTRLTDRQIAKVRALVAGGMPHRVVASRYRCDKSHISRLCSGKARVSA